ncbi:MAG: transposase [Desulforhopalus sp.]|jgi:transposase
MTSSTKSGQNQNNSGTVTDEAILKISKEIVVKFIEMGKITPAGFDLNFRNIYTTIDKTVRNK